MLSDVVYTFFQDVDLLFLIRSSAEHIVIKHFVFLSYMYIHTTHLIQQWSACQLAYHYVDMTEIWNSMQFWRNKTCWCCDTRLNNYVTKFLDVFGHVVE
jgi:hypothetical protein